MKKIMMKALLLLAVCMLPLAALADSADRAACTHSAGWDMYTADLHKCKVCKAEAAHSFRQEITKPTCKSVGYTMDVCTGCGYEGAQYNIVPAEPQAHVWGGWITTQASTCTAEGSRSHSCTVCGETKNETLPLAEHNWKKETFAPNCLSDGYTVGVCTVCGAQGEKTDIVPRSAAYHQWGEWTITLAPTCDAAGSQERVCSVCGASHRQEIKPAGHKAQMYVKEADCTDGYSVMLCSVCGMETAERTEITPAVHAWGEWTTIAEPGCESEGVQARKCSACGNVQEQAIPAKGHSFKEGTRQPTCVSDGYTAMVCSVCGAQDGEAYNIVPAGPDYHVWDEDRWEKEAEPSCTEWGLYWQGCKYCEIMKRVPIMPKGHVSEEITEEADFTHDGYSVMLCTVCGGEDGARYDIVPAGMYSADRQETQVSDREFAGTESAVLYTMVSETGEKAAVLEVRADAGGVVELNTDESWFKENGVAQVVVVSGDVRVKAQTGGVVHVEIVCEQEPEGLLVSVLIGLPGDGFDETLGEYERGVYSASIGEEGRQEFRGRCFSVETPKGPGTLLVVSAAQE